MLDNWVKIKMSLHGKYFLILYEQYYALIGIRDKNFGGSCKNEIIG